MKHCEYLDHTDPYHVDANGHALAYWNGTLTIRLIYVHVFNIDYLTKIIKIYVIRVL